MLTRAVPVVSANATAPLGTVLTQIESKVTGRCRWAADMPTFRLRDRFTAVRR